MVVVVVVVVISGQIGVFLAYIMRHEGGAKGGHWLVQVVAGVDDGGERARGGAAVRARVVVVVVLGNTG